MKYIPLLYILLFSNFFAKAQSIAINNDGSIANSNAILDIKSTTKGLLIPRMSKAEKLTIPSPIEGLIVYQTAPDSLGLYTYNQGSWKWLNPNIAENWTKINNDIYNRNSGNVGVGIANPSTKFQIMDSAGNRTKMMIRSKGFLDSTTLVFKNRNNLELGTDILLSSNAEDGLRFSSESDLSFNINPNILHVSPLGRVGVNNGASLPQQTLDITGAIKIGNSTNNVNGSIRYNAQGKLDLGNGTDWKNISLPSSALVISETQNNTELQTNGYSYYGKVSGNKDSSFTIPANSWHTISDANKTKVAYPQSVWLGTEAFVFGGLTIVTGYGYLANKSYLYNPVADTWKETTPFPLSPRYNAQMVWTGTEVIIWGGHNEQNIYFNDGAKYNPVLNSWTVMTLSNLPGSRFNAAAIWSGTEMIIWGGYSAYFVAANLDSVFKYNPTTDMWTKIFAPTNRPDLNNANNIPLAHFIAGEMFVYTDSAPWHAKFNPATNLWTPLQSSIGFAVNIKIPSVFTGSQIIFYGTDLSSSFIGKYNVSTNTWSPPISSPLLTEYCITGWSGTKAYYIGGVEGVVNPYYPTSVIVFNPSTDLAESIYPNNGVVTARAYHTGFTGNNIICFWGGSTEETASTNTGGRYFLNPITATISTEKSLYLFKKD